MRYRIRPIDGALITMVMVIIFACIEPLRGHRWSSVFATVALFVMLIFLFWQVWLWVTRSPERPKARRPVRLILCLIIVFPLGLLLMTEVLDKVARHTFLFERAKIDTARSPVLCQEVGCPVDIGWPIKVSISETSESGTGSIEVPLSGSKGHATLFAEGTKQNGAWTLNKEYFTVDRTGGVFPIPISAETAEPK